MNGVTGRMGTNQHLIRSILAIRAAGGVALPDNGGTIMPDPILVGRSASKLRALCDAHGLTRYSTDLEEVLASTKSNSAPAEAQAIYFDASSTSARFAAVRRALAAGYHVYAEKPLASTAGECRTLHAEAVAAGVRHGVVQDKLFLPGLWKLRRLLAAGFFGEVLSVRGEFGYWVFPGVGEGEEAPQRPSWNYRREEGGGIISDMLCHWQYLIEGLFGRVKSLSCLGATHVRERRGEDGEVYKCTADDAAYATFELESGIIVHFNSSWCVRVRRDDLLSIQIDGTKGSAVVGLREVWTQEGSKTPRVVWNPDVPPAVDYWEGWTKMKDEDGKEINAFRAQWESFLKHVLARHEWNHGFKQGARGVLITECAERSWKERRWIDVPALEERH